MPPKIENKVKGQINDALGDLRNSRQTTSKKSAQSQTQTSIAAGPTFTSQRTKDGKYISLLKQYKYIAIGAAALIVGGTGYMIYPKNETKITAPKPAPIVQKAPAEKSLETKVAGPVKIPAVKEYKEPVQKIKKVRPSQEEGDLSNITPYQNIEEGFPMFYFRGYIISKRYTAALGGFGDDDNLVMNLGSTVSDGYAQYIISKITKDYLYLKNSRGEEQKYNSSSRAR